MMSKWKQFAVSTGLLAAAGMTVSAIGEATASPTKQFSRSSFGNISAVDHPATLQDQLDPATAQWLSAIADSPATSSGSPLLGHARRLGMLPSGDAIFVVPTTSGEMCLVVATKDDSCGPPLSVTDRITVSVSTDGRAQPTPIVYGVAADGVGSVTFARAGITAPVHRNLYAFYARQGQSPADFAVFRPNAGTGG